MQQKQTVILISLPEGRKQFLFQKETRCHSPLFSPSTKAACQYLMLSLFASLEIESDGTI